MLKQLSIKTKRRDEMIDITSKVESYIKEQRIHTGVIYVYCPHTTAGITINENADPDVKHDMLMRLDEV